MTAADLRVGSVDDGPVSPRAEQPRRRVFTAEYKLRIVAEYDALDEPGARGALLRREGLYTSHISEWRRARDTGALGAATTGDRRPRSGRRSPEQAEMDRLRARAEKAERELARTRTALEIVGKAHALLETLSESAEPEPRSTK